MLPVKLDNGMRVVLLPDDGPDVAAVYLWFNVGSTDEAPGMEGAAHFIEHLVFKGTARYGVGEVAGAIEALGGDLNAWTGFDETVFHATVRGGNAAAAVAVLAQMTRHARFDSAELEQERRVVLEEIRGGEDDVDLVVGEALWAEIWPGDPYGRSIIGTTASVRGLPREALMAFYRERYAPSNACICVAGRFDPEVVRAAIDAEFSGGPPAPVRRAPPRARPGVAGVHHVRRRFDTHLVRLAFPAPSGVEPGAVAMDLLAATLGGGSAAPVVAEMRRLQGCFDAAVDYEAEARGGVLLFEAHVAAGRERSALNRFAELIAPYAAGDIPTADLARARTGLLAERAFRRQTADGRALDAVYYTERFGAPEAWRAYDAQLAAASPEEVAEVARSLLQPDQAFTLVLGRARAEAPTWTAATRRRATEGVRRVRLHSGATLLIEPSPSPIVAVRVVGLGGLLSERRRTAGLNAMWARTVSRGAAGLSPDALGRAASAIGGVVGAMTGRSTQALRAEMPIEGFTAGFELLLHVLLEPTFPEDEVRQARAALVQDLESRDDDPSERLSAALWAAACPGHPWGIDPVGTVAGLIRSGLSDVRRHHRNWARAGNLVFSVVGDVDPDYVVGRLESVTRHLPEGEAPPALPLPHVPGPRRVRLSSQRDQAHVSFVYPGLRVADPEAGALDVLVEALTGQSGRLFVDLREAEGLAYAVGADSLEGVPGGFVTCGLATDPARIDEAEARLEATLSRVAREGFDVESIERARASVLGAVEAELQTVGARASEMAYAERYGLDGMRYRELLRRAQGASPAAVNQLAARLLAAPLVRGRLEPA